MGNKNRIPVLRKVGISVSEHPWRMIGSTILITILMIIGMGAALETSHSEFRTNINDLFPDYEEVEIQEEIESDFGNVEPFLVLIKADDVLTPEVFSKTAEVVHRLQNDSKVLDNVIGETQQEKETSIYSLPTLLASYKLMSLDNPNPTKDMVYQVAKDFNSSDDIRALYREFHTNPIISEMEKGLVSSLLPKDYNPASNEKVRSMVLMVAVDGSLSDKELEEIELHMRDDIIDKVRDDDVKMYTYAFGLLSASYAEAEATMEPLFAIAIIAIFALSMINYRRLSDALLANLTLLIVIIWTFCIIGILGFDYNFLNIMVPLLIMGLAIDFSFHAIIGYRERLAGSDKPEVRVRGATVAMISFVGVAFILATVTTTFGFVSNVISDLPAIDEFGICSACGVIFACVLNLTFVPAVRQLLDQRRLKKGKELKGEIPPQKIAAEPGKFLKPMSKTVKHPWAFIVIIIILAIPGYVLISDMRATYDPTGELLETQEITKAFRTLNEEYSVGTEMILVRVDGDLEEPTLWQAINQSLINAGDDDYIASANGVAKSDWLGILLPTIGRFNLLYQSVDQDQDGIPDPTATSQDIRLMLDNLSKSYPMLNQYIHKDESRNQYDSVIIRIITRTNLGEHGLKARDELMKDFQPVYDLNATIQFTGEPIVWNKGLDDFRESLIFSTILVIIFAFFLLIIVFGAIYRSPGLGLLTAIPPILAFGWTLGFMALTSIPLNMMTAFVGAFTIGLGIDYPIHLVTRWVEERKRGRTITQCYTISLRSTGKELSFSALTTLSAFIAFALMPMPIMAQFGIVMVVSIFFSLLGAIFMMPLLIRFWHRKDKS